jgi:hypothetical protein
MNEPTDPISNDSSFKTLRNSNSNCCEITGFSFCPESIPAHFCLALNQQDQSVFAGVNQKITSLLLNRFGLRLICQTDASQKHCILKGFSGRDVGPIRRALVELRDDERGFALAEFGLLGMQIEYVS